MSDFRLPELALVLGKDERTVRRWCQSGRVPGAYQTAGKHWRVRTADLPGTVREVRRRSAGFARRRGDFTRRFLATAKRTRAMVRRSGLGRSPALVITRKMRVHAMALGSMTSGGLDAAWFKPDVVRQLLRQTVDGGCRAGLVVWMKQAQRDSGKITRSAVASRCGVSLRTLYRIFPREVWQPALAAAWAADYVRPAQPAEYDRVRGDAYDPKNPPRLVPVIEPRADARPESLPGLAGAVIDALRKLAEAGRADDDAGLAAAMGFAGVEDFRRAIPREVVAEAVAVIDAGTVAGLVGVELPEAA